MFRRIAIVGAPGTGKTTLSSELSKIYKLPVTHLDGVHHLPNWKTRSKEERDEIILSKISEDNWIIDGTYRHTLKPRFERATLIIWLDYSTFAQLKGVLKRFFQNPFKEKAEIPGCKERLSLTFLSYVCKYNKTKRHYIVENLDSIDSNKVLIFKKQKDLNIWLKNKIKSRIL